jgi:hypothetical protein
MTELRNERIHPEREHSKCRADRPLLAAGRLPNRGGQGKPDQVVDEHLNHAVQEMRLGLDDGVEGGEI